jgi:hypothetical protein
VLHVGIHQDTGANLIQEHRLFSAVAGRLPGTVAYGRGVSGDGKLTVSGIEHHHPFVAGRYRFGS